MANRNSDGLADVSRLALASDFQDYYDAFFDDCGAAFSRVRARALPPADMFRMLERLEYLVPSHGLVRELADVFMDKKDPGAGGSTKLVVHGPGFKMLIGVQDALEFFPDEYAAEFVGPAGVSGAVARRVVQVGDEVFVLNRESQDDWRSGRGASSSRILIHQKGGSLRVPYALAAIDFVSANGEYLAVDLDSAPRLAGTGIETALSGDAVVGAIKRWLAQTENAAESGKGRRASALIQTEAV